MLYCPAMFGTPKSEADKTNIVLSFIGHLHSMTVEKYRSSCVVGRRIRHAMYEAAAHAIIIGKVFGSQRVNTGLTRRQKQHQNRTLIKYHQYDKV